MGQKKIASLMICKFGNDLHGERMFIAFVKDHTLITSSKFQPPMSFSVKDIASCKSNMVRNLAFRNFVPYLRASFWITISDNF